MPKQTVATLTARVEELETVVSQLVSADNYQAALAQEVASRLHREKLRARKGNKSTHRSRPSNPGTSKATRERVCNVPGDPHGDETVTHNVSELQQCWQAYYSSRTS